MRDPWPRYRYCRYCHSLLPLLKRTRLSSLDYVLFLRHENDRLATSAEMSHEKFADDAHTVLSYRAR